MAKKTRKRAITKALQLEGHLDFAPVDLACYQHFLGFFVRKCCVLGSSAWQRRNADHVAPLPFSTLNKQEIRTYFTVNLRYLLHAL